MKTRKPEGEQWPSVWMVGMGESGAGAGIRDDEG